MLRTGSHRLQIELGRHSVPKVPIERRICTQCVNNKVEDEFHFVMECTRHADARRILITAAEIQFPAIRYLSEMERFKWLMSDHQIANAVAEFVDRSFTLRNY